MTDQPLKDALQAVLLFHSASPWEGEKVYEWQRICRGLLGNAETYNKLLISSAPVGFPATTRTLCDMVRAALKQTETQPVP